MTKLAGWEWSVLSEHVAPFDPANSGYVSTFNAALREARTLTSRDLRTGKYTGSPTATLWAGTVVYLILLEQIGVSLRPNRARRAVHKRQRVKRQDQAIEKALRQFAPTHATATERVVLYALRCALAHQYGLFNRNARHPILQRVFQLDDTPGGRLVIHPRRRWNGEWADANLQTSTTVNLITVADTTEEVVRSVRAHSNAQTLRSAVPIHELQKRFGYERT